MSDSIFRVIIYISCFMACFTCLSWVKFDRFLQPSKSKYGIFLLFILSMALAYLMAEFLLGLQL